MLGPPANTWNQLSFLYLPNDQITASVLVATAKLAKLARDRLEAEAKKRKIP